MSDPRAGASVETRGVSRLFRLGAEDVWAVHGIDLRVEPGEFVALVGRSGSGKTTLLNLIAGLDRPTEGEVVLDGRVLSTLSEGELTQIRRRDLGFIFQSFGLLPLLSAQENVELPLRIGGVGHSDRVRRSKEALERVGLARRASHRPYELSGGEQQRVAIARAMVSGPRLVLADEPTGELDSTTAKAVFGLLRDLARERGITVVACTHDRLVMEMADRVEELADGRLLPAGRQTLWTPGSRKGRGEITPGRVTVTVAEPASPEPERVAEGQNGHPPAGIDGQDAAKSDPDEPGISRWARPGGRS